MSYWHFDRCRYEKTLRSCSEPEFMATCPLPCHDLRNGRLNQTAYHLFFFIRDVARGDLVSWIDHRRTAAGADVADRLAAMRASLVEPLRNVYGVSDCRGRAGQNALAFDRALLPGASAQRLGDGGPPG